MMKDLLDKLNLILKVGQEKKKGISFSFEKLDVLKRKLEAYENSVYKMTRMTHCLLDCQLEGIVAYRKNRSRTKTS